jgi:hypothetical protein
VAYCGTACARVVLSVKGKAVAPATVKCLFSNAPVSSSPAPTLPSLDTFSLSLRPQQSGPEARGLSPSTHVSSRLALLLHLVSHYSLEYSLRFFLLVAE